MTTETISSPVIRRGVNSNTLRCSSYCRAPTVKNVVSQPALPSPINWCSRRQILLNALLYSVDSLRKKGRNSWICYEALDTKCIRSLKVTQQGKQVRKQVSLSKTACYEASSGAGISLCTWNYEIDQALLT